jgi:hypothetical protein
MDLLRYYVLYPGAAKRAIIAEAHGIPVDDVKDEEVAAIAEFADRIMAHDFSDAHPGAMVLSVTS